MILKCQCGNKWDYNGKNEFTATCPDCRALVVIKERKKKEVLR